MPPRAAADLTRIRQDVEAACVVDLTQRFTMLMRACGLDGDQLADAMGELDSWLLETRTCGAAALKIFAAGLAQDGPAVRAALTTFWSNAQAEGQISRLKMLKRTMYGRASIAAPQRAAIAVRFADLTRRPYGESLRAGFTAAFPTLQGRFGDNLRRDREALLGTITTPWLTNPVEGQISPLEMLVRTMFGRTDCAPLRQSVLATR